MIGRLALWVGLLAALAAAALAMRVLRRRSSAAVAVSGELSPDPAAGAGWALAAAVAAAVLATGELGRALVGNDFAVTYVADFSRRDASAPYRLAALWGGMAGSLLFFAAVAGVVGLLAAWHLRGRPAQPVVVAVTGALVAALIGLVLGLADPFERLDLPPLDGGGLPPILEHPAMLYHPPLLYLGLATLAAPFALTVAGLLGGPSADGGGSGREAAALVRRWLMVPWTLLAVGMVAGAHWAYVELGWGGYWAWDPVENTALLPWLGITLALHAGIREGGRSRGRAQAAFVCVAFLLALTGTMLTRSGAVPSVHAFAEDEAIGRALATLLAGAVVAVLVLFVRTRPAGAPAEPALPTARTIGEALGAVPVRGLLAAQMAIVGAALAITFVGTVAPLYSDLTGGDGIAIEGRYFASFAGPLAAAGLALLALVPIALRLRAGAAVALDDLVPLGVGVILGGGVLSAAQGDVRLPQLVLACVAGAALASALVGGYDAVREHRPAPPVGVGPAGSEPAATVRRGRVGPHLAHAGLGLLLLGVAGTATGRTVSVSLAPGETVEVLGEQVRYVGVWVDDGQDDGSSAVVADVEHAGRTLQPALVAYPNLRRVLPETSLVSSPWRDVQVALADAADDGTAVLRVGVHPLQVWVWWGGLTIVAAGVLTAGEHRWSSRRPSPESSVVAPASPSRS